MKKLIIGTLAVAGIAFAAPAHAQGIWFGTPGFSIGFGFGPAYGYGYPYYRSAFWGPSWDYYAYAGSPSYYRWGSPYRYRTAWRYRPSWYGSYAYYGYQPFFGARTYAYRPAWRGYAYAPQWRARVHVRHVHRRHHRY